MDRFPFRRPTAHARALRLITPALLAAVFSAGQVYAQTASGDAPEREPVRTLEQKTERIVHHDAGSRIEELRVGGQTRSIEVQTNSRVPSYQVQPIDPARGLDDKGPTGKSSWRVLKF